MAFATPEAACSYVESPDVEDGVYRAVYDAEGTRLAFEVRLPTERARFLFFWTVLKLTPVSLRALEEQPTGSEELRSLLMPKFGQVGKPSTLADLVRLAASRMK